MSDGDETSPHNLKVFGTHFRKNLEKLGSPGWGTWVEKVQNAASSDRSSERCEKSFFFLSKAVSLIRTNIA